MSPHLFKFLEVTTSKQSILSRMAETNCYDSRVVISKLARTLASAKLIASQESSAMVGTTYPDACTDFNSQLCSVIKSMRVLTSILAAGNESLINWSDFMGPNHWVVNSRSIPTEYWESLKDCFGSEADGHTWRKIVTAIDLAQWTLPAS